MYEELMATIDVPVAVTSEQTRSFEDFFQEEYSGVYGALCLVTRNRHEAEEIAQDAFMKMWELWDRVDSLDDPVAYVHSVAMNAFRRRSRRARMALRRSFHLSPPDDLISTVEETEAVVRRLAPLSPKERAAIVLTDLLGYTSEEAGQMLSMRPGAVRSLASRGRAELRRHGRSGTDDAGEG